MDDKIYDLLEKVYIELQSSKKELKQDIVNIENRLTKIEMKIEHDISNKFDSIYEAQTGTNKRLDSIENTLINLSEKVDRHDIRIEVFEGGKKKKNTV